ncbi:2-keto-4-pentenoate hydratase/2-oxohepta-3-ene-1,7-dioic acid hydratase (catechol pathway) [Amycolatopsis arida]|uniref:2-keto-4-pentenoate hydratase/2-oxohepta-3-ene-1,7-dioic acid hydratase (Catechol pathway) n=1 Tax=Amycolatopsis arida TaxID=587909 RepID=A0A1I5VTC7_9PSEU|nr:fumarylacetoacetate hydrolase family protein [Amycolatopsis arida]TDX88019.1 2-keto-4-pentenoate hydratase/2-oxohepta-3-ene-1,7-dioic acid hydratase in catechol pathway [Amycolatopsis arida]SFQ10732.1 2-keto-4-pentenoate hydratase/2-oxohepta-3-ene-1,7-dioic acid hydratase (catechol pathway) [Amycolatopsis arida]
MKLARLGPDGGERPAVVDGGTTYDLSGLTADVDGAFLASGGIAAARRALAVGELPELPGARSLRIGAPIARPSAVICVGMNYAAHAAESGSAPPRAPIVFLKTPNTVAGPNDAVEIPPGSERTDWEVELGVVIGARTLRLGSPADALAHIAGFVVGNDVSERRHQLVDSGGQWSKGKCAPGFNPLGPWLVTPDEVDHADLRLRSWVNGEPRQDSTTADMIFGVEHLVWHLSQYLALEPGDVIMTGTPQGVALSGRFPYLAPGDVVELEIAGLGRQRQEFVKAGER